MFLRYMAYFIGLLLSSTGLVFIIIYLNLMNIGYSFIEYVNFIIRRVECINFVIGIIIMFLSMYKRKEKKYDIYLRYTNKL